MVVRVDRKDEPLATVEQLDCILANDIARKEQRWFWDSSVFGNPEALRAIECVIVDVVAKLPGEHEKR